MNVMVDLPKRIFIRVYECLLFGKKTTQHSLLIMHEKNISMPLFKKKILYIMTQWVTGTQNSVQGLMNVFRYICIPNKKTCEKHAILTLLLNSQICYFQLNFTREDMK